MVKDHDLVPDSNVETFEIGTIRRSDVGHDLKVSKRLKNFETLFEKSESSVAGGNAPVTLHFHRS